MPINLLTAEILFHFFSLST